MFQGYGNILSNWIFNERNKICKNVLRKIQSSFLNTYDIIGKSMVYIKIIIRYRIWIKKTSTDFIVKLDEEKDPD
jgi:hypothetical protein